jgi:hypothetical protein
MNAVILLTVQIERMLEAYPPVADFIGDLKGQVGWHRPLFDAEGLSPRHLAY